MQWGHGRAASVFGSSVPFPVCESQSSPVGRVWGDWQGKKLKGSLNFWEGPQRKEMLCEQPVNAG